jgi:Cell division protein CrgA
VAPPKRKSTGGRVTAKGTRPGESNRLATHGASAESRQVGASTRYTPPTPKSELESPRWVPILMAVLIGIGVLIIFMRYVIWQDTNLPVLFGLGFLLAGLYTATKWH